MNQFESNWRLFEPANETLCMGSAANVRITGWTIGRATSHERLLCSGLRYNLGFLVSHFWLLSESVDSLFVFYFLRIRHPPGGLVNAFIRP